MDDPVSFRNLTVTDSRRISVISVAIYITGLQGCSGTHTLDFSRKTTNAALSYPQIADEVNQFFEKLQTRSSKALLGLNVGITATWNSAMTFL